MPRTETIISFISLIQGHPTSNISAAASGIQIDEWDCYTIEHQLLVMGRVRIKQKSVK